MTDATFVVQPHDGRLPMGVLPYALHACDETLLMVMAGAARFGDATFEQPMRQLSAGGHLATGFIMPVAQFATEAAELTGGEASIVYHVGRCGSTLLTRMLGVDPSLCVFSEPSAWAQLQRI